MNLPTSRLFSLGVIFFCLLSCTLSSQAANKATGQREKNAYDFFMKAHAAITNLAVLKRLRSTQTQSEQQPAFQREVAQFVQKNVKALQLVRDGLKYPFHQPMVQYVDDPMPDLPKYRDLAALLSFSAQAAALRRDMDGAGKLPG